MNKLYYLNYFNFLNFLLFWVGVWCMVGGCMVGVWWVYVWWITTVVIIRPSQPSLAGVGAGAELGNKITFLPCYIIQQFFLTKNPLDIIFSFGPKLFWTKDLCAVFFNLITPPPSTEIGKNLKCRPFWYRCTDTRVQWHHNESQECCKGGIIF